MIPARSFSAAPRIEFFKALLHSRPLPVRANARLPIGSFTTARNKVLPGRDSPRMEVIHEIPQRGPQHVVREAGKPGDVDAERHVLVQSQVAWQLSFHEREWSIGDRPRPFDFLDRMR